MGLGSQMATNQLTLDFIDTFSLTKVSWHLIPKDIFINSCSIRMVGTNVSWQLNRFTLRKSEADFFCNLQTFNSYICYSFNICTFDMTFKGKAMIVTKFFGIYLVPSYSYLTRQALIKFCSDLIRQIRLLIDIRRDRNRMKFDNFLVYCIFFYHKFSCYRLSLISLIVNTRSEGYTTFLVKKQVLTIHLKMTTIS